MSRHSISRALYSVWLAVLLCATSSTAGAQERKMHRVVFEVTTDSPEQWQAILNNVENVQKAFGKESTEVAVVAHGKGLDLLKKGDSPAAGRIATLASPTTRFLACENTMRRMQIKKEDLLPEAGTVDSGVAEVVRRQEGGWSYIKSGS